MKNKKKHHVASDGFSLEKFWLSRLTSDGFSVGKFLTLSGFMIEMLTDSQRLNLARFVYAIAVHKEDPYKAFCDNFPEAQSFEALAVCWRCSNGRN